MGLMDWVKPKPRTKGGTVIVLTPLGKTKAEKADLPGTKFRVLSALNESGPCTIHELRGSRHERGQSESYCRAAACRGLCPALGIH